MNHTVQSICHMLETRDDAVGRALVALNARQTEDERAAETTKHDNGRGFRSCDARMGTSMAKQYLQRGFLTPKQLAYWRKPNKNGKPRIACYATQLLIVAKEKAQLTANF